MARNRGKKALYEVMSKARLKPGYGRTLEQMRPKTSDEDKPPTEEKAAAEMPNAAAQWWRKPRIVQFNSGRVEFSIPYPLVIALLLLLVLLLLAAFRFGQYSYLAEEGRIESASEKQDVAQEDPAGQATLDRTRAPVMTERRSPPVKRIEPTESTGNNVIVLVEFGRRADLEPVKAHFAQNGIETEIVNWGGKYFLITKDRYDSFESGTDGYKVLQKIKQVGPKYKAPANYEPFATHFFTDAYGRKVN